LGEITVKINTISCDVPATMLAIPPEGYSPPDPHADSEYGEKVKALSCMQLFQYLSQDPNVPKILRDSKRIVTKKGKGGRQDVLRPDDPVYPGDVLTTRPPARVG
jgi:hypothetical protein